MLSEFSPPLLFLAVAIWGPVEGRGGEEDERRGGERGEQWGVGKVTEGRGRERSREFRRPKEYPTLSTLFPSCYSVLIVNSLLTPPPVFKSVYLPE